MSNKTCMVRISMTVFTLHYHYIHSIHLGMLTVSACLVILILRFKWVALSIQTYSNLNINCTHNTTIKKCIKIFVLSYAEDDTIATRYSYIHVHAVRLDSKSSEWRSKLFRSLRSLSVGVYPFTGLDYWSELFLFVQSSAFNFRNHTLTSR